MRRKLKNIKREIRGLFQQEKWKNTLGLIEQVEKFGQGLGLKIHTIKGWCFFKQAESIKEPIPRRTQLLMDAIKIFKLSAVWAKNETEEKISAYRGIILSEFLLGERSSVWKKAYWLVKRYPKEYSAWEVMTDLCKLDGNHEVAVEVFQEMYEIAILGNDYERASQAKFAKGEELITLRQMEKGYRELLKAIDIYLRYQRQKDKFLKETEFMRKRAEEIRKQL
ncbi:MAG: hypothetical protein ABH919_03795 [bacterium]